MSFTSEWAEKTLESKKKSLAQLINLGSNDQPPDYIDIVRAVGHWGVYASNGPHFHSAIFGRDSLVVGEDLLNTHQALVRDILLTLARLQGVSLNNISEEEPGKIHHEFRAKTFDGIAVAEHSIKVLSELQRVWGGAGTDSMTYYGSHDATLLYVRLLCNYVRRYGAEILDEAYITKDGQKKVVSDSVRAAGDWIVGKIRNSNSGLLEYKRLNPNGLANQAWKDSATAYINKDGSLPDFDRGIASVELQGYAFDALTSLAHLPGQSVERVELLLKLAAQIKDLTLELLWMKDEAFFAQGLYVDSNGKTRQIDSLTSNAALILDSKLLHALPEQRRHYYVHNVAKVVTKKQFMTNAGIRSRSLKLAKFPGFIDYHGSYTVWPKETNAAAKGLHNHGLHALAMQFENRLVDAILNSGEFYEFHYADTDGKVWYDHKAAMTHFNSISPGGDLPVPEPGQAWTISAVLRILNTRHRYEKMGAGADEKSLLENLQKISLTSHET
ncbi:MAG TPA: hypothetical protein VMR34_02630 [Candidatus Saccharimonadales bacterium]|nr:hypothetical protein [Candidatus Saccharimonadales bacterium]